MKKLILLFILNWVIFQTVFASNSPSQIPLPAPNSSTGAATSNSGSIPDDYPTASTPKPVHADNTAASSAQISETNIPTTHTSSTLEATKTTIETHSPLEVAPTNTPPADPNSIEAGPPQAPVPSHIESDAAQFQHWLQSNTAQKHQKPTSHPTTEEVPPPPISTQVPPPPGKLLPKKIAKRKYRPMHVQTGPNAPLVESPPMTYEEQKEIMRGMAPPLAIPPHPESDIAFNSMMQQNMPLTPEQVIRLRQLIDTSQRAAAIPPTIPPKPVSTTLMVNLAPGSTPPAIRLAQGYISSLVFVDASGSPWPVAAYDIGDPKIVNIQWDGKSNIMMMQATSPYSSGNLVIRLVGLETPVTLELVSGQRVVDYRTDIHVPGVGPNSKGLPTGTGLPECANQLLLSVLDGIAPPGSKQLKVVGGDCQAWSLGDKMFLRTRLTLLSPGWIGKMSSPDGMMAYELQLTSSVLVSQYGNPTELKIEGF